MSQEWMQLRIQEERDRRKIEADTRARLPEALLALHAALLSCIEGYGNEFGRDAAGAELSGSGIRVTVRDQQDGRWERRAEVEINIVPALPGFRVETKPGEAPFEIEVGMLAGNQLFFRERGVFLGMPDLTRRILDRVLFPRLPA